jgi:hypothetical protein
MEKDEFGLIFGRTRLVVRDRILLYFIFFFEKYNFFKELATTDYSAWTGINRLSFVVKNVSLFH